MKEVEIKKLDIDNMPEEDKKELIDRMAVADLCKKFVSELTRGEAIAYYIDICQTYYKIIKELQAIENKDKKQNHKLNRAMIILDFFDYALGRAMAEDLNQNKPEKKDLN